MPATGNKSILSYRLSIRTCADGFSFLVHSTGSGQLLFAERVRQSEDETPSACLGRGLELARIKSRSYERVTFYSTLPSTRLPLDEFRREDMLAVYRLTYVGTQARYEDMRCQVLPSLEVVEVFPLQSQVEQVLRKYYPNSQIKGLYGTLLNIVAEKQQGSTHPLTFNVVAEGDSILIAVLKNARLSYANVFYADTDANRMYYIMMVWKSLNLDQWHDYCYLYGTAREFQNSLSQYICNVQTSTCEL